MVQTLVEQFLEARPKALEVARREQQLAASARKPGKRKRTVLDSDDALQPTQDGRTTRSKSRRIATSSQGSQPEAIEIDDSDGEDGEYAPDAGPDDGLVECLFGCGKRIKPDQMDTHLDKCEQEKQEAQRAKSRTPVQSLGLGSLSSQQKKAPERISELNHSLLNDIKLRQKLKTAGVPNWGNRQLLIKRHTEWVNLWNANCDSGGRKTQRELLRELDAWERTQGGNAPHSNGLSSTIMRKDFDGDGWASNNKDDFSRLIADARRKKSNATEPEAEATLKSETSKGHTRGLNMLADRIAAESKSEPPPLTQENIVEPEQPLHPHEPNPEYLSSVREKVEAANEASLERRRASSTIAPSRMLDNTGSGSRDEHAVDTTTTGSPCDLAVHLHSSPVKKVPMFMVPQQPVSDVDAGGEGR